MVKLVEYLWRVHVQRKYLGHPGALGAIAQQTQDVEGFMDRELGPGHTPAPIGHVQEVLPRLGSVEVT